MLSAPSSALRCTLPLEAYPAELRADIYAFRRRLATRGLSPLRPVTVKNHASAADGARRSGGLRRKTRGNPSARRPCPARALAGNLNWHWQRAGRKITVNSGIVAET
jgi:hypothetical protein